MMRPAQHEASMADPDTGRHPRHPASHLKHLEHLEHEAAARALHLLEEPLRHVERYETSAWADIKAFTLHGKRAAIALRVTGAILAAVLIAHVIGLEMPVWAGISALRVFQNDSTDTLLRGLERIVGTFVGVGLAFAIMLGGAHLWFVYLATGLVCAGAVYAQAVSRYSYAFILVGFTVPLMTYHAISSSEPIAHVILMRGLEVCLGVAIATLVDYFTSRKHTSHAPQKPLIGDLDPVFLGHALTVGIAVTAVPVIWTTFHLPGFDQTPITAFIVVGAAKEGIGWKSLNRCMGCVLGAMLGLVGMLVLKDSFLPWLAFLAFGLFLFTQICYGGSAIAYTGVQAAIAFLLILVQEPIPHLDIDAGFARMWGIAGGIALVMVVGLITWPVRRRIHERVTAHGRAAHQRAD
ncbi:MAG: hypothetical protein B7Z15_14420 [Rhizobiales bacterium 32-66-8]|nr:MAG: hypothetical protein B7Z15_14420 [Rhizobiales bacterium 32-66-8]